MRGWRGEGKAAGNYGGWMRGRVKTCLASGDAISSPRHDI